MGYESSVIVVDRNEHLRPVGKWVFGDKIATLNLGVMTGRVINGKSFYDVFDTPIDFDLYHTSDATTDEDYRVDCYGKHCNYTTIDKLIEWLIGAMEADTELAGYRRAKMLLSTLKALKESESDFDELVVVHYGH